MKIRKEFLKSCFSIMMIISLFAQSAFMIFPKIANAQASGGASGQVTAGFDVGGIAASALNCSGLMDKLAGLLDSLFSVKEVPVGDSALRKKEECFDGIAHEIVVKIMDKMTLATVDWINNGFEGSPLYLEDPEKFFTNIAVGEINGLTGWFTASPDGYPFGQIVMTTILTNLQRQFSQNVRFSLNEVLAHGTYEEFKTDFSVGGWAGYTAFLEPNNNPFGNYLLVNHEIGKKIAGTHLSVSENFQKQLQQSGGFLNQRQCVMTATGDSGDEYIPADDPMHVPQGGPPPQALYDAIGWDPNNFGPLTEAQSATLDEYTKRSQCVEWKTLTPGKVVADQLTTALNLPANQLVQADELSEDLGLIFDALLLQLTKTGLNALNPRTNNSDSTNVLLAQVHGQQPGQVANGNIPPPATDSIQGTGSVDTAAVDVQNQFITAAGNPNNGAVVLLTKLIQEIRSLDYCVPGPNPRWLTNATNNFQQAVNTISPMSPGESLLAREDYYAGAINTLTGVSIVHSPAMAEYGQFTAFMQNVFNAYSTRMQADYSLTNPPPTTRLLLSSLFTDMDTYQSELDSLNTYLSNINGVLPVLNQVQLALANLQAQNNGVLDQNDPNVQAQISIFDSISSHLATQDQLATLLARIQVYQAQIAVVEGHLNSCIAETTNPNYNHPHRRVTYPTTTYPYPGLPGADGSFLLNVNLGSDSGDINVEYGDVQVLLPSDGLGTFEGVLQSVY